MRNDKQIFPECIIVQKVLSSECHQKYENKWLLTYILTSKTPVSLFHGTILSCQDPQITLSKAVSREGVSSRMYKNYIAHAVQKTVLAHQSRIGLHSPSQPDNTMLSFHHSLVF